ncbi:hypothetical protein I3760_09G215600 [Carya illinoinensis]|uniref:RWP-RK domain-containing protein n=1 Tax=Carya illinoinensis TaxID=32201 RepID=A0A8T1PPM5_CARIL|nr:uncharacterized protein LOC122277520 [Carya illinoinensis]KAG2690972.1 hypothetical protein I3760_09G215600 [Carya illinoinensis]KAG6643471.1 hypothetical protein CIPAW_09G214400 [Carya illinoinensis]KAG6697768.1 hypothetical protein I3842_09G218500 [Carya illinoinensis]
MADPSAIVPYIDPHDRPLTDNINFDFMNDSIPTLGDLSSFALPTSPHFEAVAHLLDVDPSEDPAAGDMRDDSNNSGAGNKSQAAGPSESANDGNARPLFTWPVAPIPFNCSCCHVLREIIYSNGTNTKKLEIHGRLGMICHAVLEDLQNVYGNSSSNQYQMFDFCKKSIEDVKQFLMKYCLEQNIAGYVMVPDPLANYYEALCVGLEWDDDDVLLDDLNFQPSPTNSGGARPMNEPEATGPTHKVSLAAQRERAGKLTLNELGPYFNLPIEEAAKRLKLCPTVLKKICRRDGMNRWPHRKVKSLQKQISSLRASLESNINAEERANAQAEIDRLEQELTNVCRGVTLR